MSGKPSIEGLELQPCCVEALQQIQEKVKLGNALAVALGGGLFATLVAGRGRTANVGTAYNVATTDWDLFGKALKAVPLIVKNRCQLISGMEVLGHSGGKLGEFWRAMESSFR